MYHIQGRGLGKALSEMKPMHLLASVFPDIFTNDLMITKYDKYVYAV
jgi:hypothetical protein